MSFTRWRQPHRSRCRAKRHIRALDVAAGQVLGYRTRAGGENRSRACPGDTQLLRSNVCDFIQSVNSPACVDMRV